MFNPALHVIFNSVSSGRQYVVTGRHYNGSEVTQIEATSNDDEKKVILCPYKQFVEWIQDEKITYVGVKKPR